MKDALWFKVNGHYAFDETKAYRALTFIPAYSETGWAYWVFLTEHGHTYSVQVWRCTGLPRTCEWGQIDHTLTSRPQTETEALFPWAEKPPTRNPDLDTDL